MQKHLSKVTHETQCDFGHHEYQFDCQYVKASCVSTVNRRRRNRYHIHLGDRSVKIKNYISARVKAKAGIVETKKLYVERFNTRTPVLYEWSAFGIFFAISRFLLFVDYTLHQSYFIICR